MSSIDRCNAKYTLGWGGIAGGLAGSAIIVLTLPYLLRILKRDPQVAARPIALAASDMLTLLLYFNFARWLLA